MPEQSEGNNHTSKINVFHGKNIYFTRVIVDLALLGHQTLDTQNKLFFSLVGQ